MKTPKKTNKEYVEVTWRRTWTRNPKTQVVPSKKKYNRQQSKKEFKKELE